MINRVTSTIPKAVNVLANNAGKKGGRLTRFMQSPKLHKVLEMADENQLLTNSLYALALCCVARPITNFAITEDKQDAAYASAHSISSGTMGFIWTMILATPIAIGLKSIAKNPHKYLKPERVKQFYPNVKIVDELDEAGKKIGEKIATNAKGEMLRNDGTILTKSIEPFMISGEKERAAFEAKNAGFFVDVNNGGVVRSKTVFQTEKGQFKLDKAGNKIGCAVQGDKLSIDKDGNVLYELAEKDAEGNNKRVLLSSMPDRALTPITEEMEIGIAKEQNVHKFINMVPDTILAIPRAWLTIKLIPPVLKGLGIQKNSKGKEVGQQDNNNNATPVTLAMRSAQLKSPFSAMRKGA